MLRAGRNRGPLELSSLRARRICGLLAMSNPHVAAWLASSAQALFEAPQSRPLDKPPQPSDSIDFTPATPTNMGAMMMAMAWKVKYRITFTNANAAPSYKTRVPWDSIGVHQHNRGSLFPQVDTLKALATGVFSMGFSLEEADHMGLAVEVPEGDDSSHRWNLAQVAGNAELQPCFPGDSVINDLFLTHTHLGLVVKAFKAAAPWHLEPAIVGANSTLALCGFDGNLSTDALAGHPNGTDFCTLMSLGYYCEKLAARIQTEEPTACRVIAAAYNMKNDVALQATELQALECLTAEITLRNNAEHGADVSFNAVKAKVMGELNILASDPDLVELFDFIVGLGARGNTYLAGFMRFGSRFVNQKKRRMRLSGYKVVNEIGDDKPRAKVAVLKFYYKSQAVHGYVQNPGPHWGTLDGWKMEALEQALHYFHATCKASIEALPDQYLQDQFIASADTTLVGALDKIHRTTKLDEVQLALATAARKKRLELQAKTRRPGEDEKDDVWRHQPSKECMWLQSIAINDVLDPKAKGGESNTTEGEAKAKVLSFDEVSGKLLEPQNTFQAPETKGKTETLWEDAPWQEWFKGELSTTAASATHAHTLAFNVLQMLHGMPAIADAPVTLQYCAATKTTRLVTSRDVKKGEVFIPVWVSDLTHLKAKSESRNKVAMRVVAKKPTNNERQGKASIEASPDQEYPGTIVYAMQEVKLPQHNAAANQIWLYSESTRLHPFWLATSLTAELSVSRKMKINCEYQDVSFTTLSIGTWQGASAGDTYEVVVPVLTNSSDLVKGTQLVVEMEATEAKTKEGKSLSWKEKNKDLQDKSFAEKKRKCASKAIAEVQSKSHKQSAAIALF